MSQAEELLNNSVNTRTTNSMVEGKIIIGEDRFITVPEELKRVAVQFDHNIETVWFECPRYWDNHDLSQMKIYINYQLSNKTLGSFIAENVTVDIADSKIIYFSWTISNYVTQVPGPISFLVCAKEVDDKGLETLHWNSELNQQLFVSQGLECEEPVYYQNPDILTKLLVWMENVPDAKVSVDTVSIDGGTRVTIATPYQAKTFDVMNGKNGYDPLIVTGTFPSGWSNISGEAFTVISNLSHTLDDMASAFLAGRDVRIKLINTDSSYEFGNWHLNYAELSVYNVVANMPAAGYYNFNSVGTGYATEGTTVVRIEASMSNTLSLKTSIKS